ncbi:unnamed protein product [Ophioblennius macclurei]
MQNAEFPRIKSLTNESLMESLPSEILFRILSYLDISSLLCVAEVNKLFHRLASDDVIWFGIYTSEFSSLKWQPKRMQEEVQPMERCSVGHWKKKYFRTVAIRQFYEWRKELKVVNPHTGLPLETEHVLRSLKVSWELRLRDIHGQTSRRRQNRAVYSGTSLILRWSGDDLPRYPDISSLQLHAVHRGAPNSPGRIIPGWSSLVLDLDVGSAPSQFLGTDRLVVLRGLPHGVVVGIWRGESRLAFVMISLHLHRLAEKSFLGSPTRPYREPVTAPLAKPSDLEVGLRGYTLILVLHNTDTQIMLGCFPHLSCDPAQTLNGLVELSVISRTNAAQHRPLSGGVKMLWKSCGLTGSVENCCFMTLNLLDQVKEPFWCESAPVCVRRILDRRSGYGGDHFLMEHCGAQGHVKTELVWLKDQRQFFLISLAVYVSVVKVNEHFGTTR